MKSPSRRYLPLVLAGPLATPAMLMFARSHIALGGLDADALAGFVGGVGIGLSLLGFVRMRRAQTGC